MVEEVREVREVRAPVWEAETPWMVAYLREDIQDLRNEVREVRRSIQRLDEKLNSGLTRLNDKIDKLRREMGVQLRWIIGIVIGSMATMTGVFAWIVDRMLTP